MAKILIKNGLVVNDDASFKADVFTENGIIKHVGKDFVIPDGTKVIDAEGKLVIPGGIDTHTHFELSFMGTKSIDDFFMGTKAALAGGTTMIMDFVMDRDSQSLIKSYEKWRSLADAKVCCDYGLHVVIPGPWCETKEKEMEILVREKGINSFKMFMTYRDYKMNDDDLLNTFIACRKNGAIAQIHAENDSIITMKQRQMLEMGITGPEGHLLSRPEEAEAEATFRAIVLANQVNCPLYVVHVMSKTSADIIAKKRQEGCVVFGETIAASLGTDGAQYFNTCWKHAAGHVMSPPLRRDPETKTYLMDMLSSGGLQVTGTDNCTFTTQQKKMGEADFTKIPNGVNGVEDRMAIVWQKGVAAGKISPCQFVAITSTNAAKIFNIYPQKGRIEVGSDADIVVWDPNSPHIISAETHHQAVDFNIFEGMNVTGEAIHVISRGNLVVENKYVKVQKGAGQFVSMPAFSPYAFECSQLREAFKVEPVKRYNYSMQASSEDGNSLKSPAAGPRMRPLTQSGARNLQDSTFVLSDSQTDDNQNLRSGIRVNNPPGGHSSGLW